MDLESENLIKNNYPILFNKDVICVAIHVRMNYANCINYNFNYFSETIEFFKNKFSNVHFLVFSNNVSSIENWFNDKNLYTYVTGNIDYIDLWIMSLCKHNIITHSTFSWWGAYLNNNPDKIVTFPTETLKILGGGLNRKFKFLQRRTEGHEMNVLLGFEEEIKKCKLIQFEYGGTFKEVNVKLIDIINYLKSYDFIDYAYLSNDGYIKINDFNDHYCYCNIICFNSKYGTLDDFMN